MDISDNLRERVRIKRKTGITDAGDPVYTSSLTIPARVERLTVTVNSGEGATMTEDTRLFTIVQTKESDLIFLEGEDDSNNDNGHRINRVEPMKDLDGVLSHYESYF